MLDSKKRENEELRILNHNLAQAINQNNVLL